MIRSQARQRPRRSGPAMQPDPARAAGPGGLAGRGGAGGRGGPGGFAAGRAGFLGGRGVQQNRLFATTNYSYGGSALDSPPFELRGDTPAPDTPYSHQSFGGTIGRPSEDPAPLRRYATNELRRNL